MADRQAGRILLEVIAGSVEELPAFNRAGVDDVAVGFLSRDREIDFETMKTVLQEAQGLTITFYPAFDHVRDHQRALIAPWRFCSTS